MASTRTWQRQVGLCAVPVKRPLSSERRRIIQRHVLTHDQYRILRHYVIDPERAMLVNLLISMVGLPWADVLGSPNAALHQPFFYTGRIIKFPKRRSGIAKLKAELEEVKRAIAQTTLPAGAKAEAVCADGT